MNCRQFSYRSTTKTARLLKGSSFGLIVAVFFLGTCLEQTAYGQSEKIRKAITRGVDYLRTTSESKDREKSIVAYAMLKGGESVDSKHISAAISAVKNEIDNKGNYRDFPRLKNRQIVYQAGCDLMLLEAAGKAGKVKYQNEIQAITNFLIKSQLPGGYWNYLDGVKKADTSVTQFALLGLWSAERAGVKIPPKVWEKTAKWLISSQKNNGGFSYNHTHEATLSMTAAGVASLLIIHEYLFPNHTFNAKKTVSRPNKADPVQNLEIDEEVDENISKKSTPKNYVPKISRDLLTKAIQSGLNWSNNYCRNKKMLSGNWPIYTVYGIERMGALGKIKNLGGRSWYETGAKELLARQSADGQWTGRSGGPVPNTCFGILFLARTTAKILGQPTPDFGSGLLQGNRGLPDDLSTLTENKDGQITKRPTPPEKSEDLLSALLNTKSFDVEDVPEKLVEQIKLGSEKERKQWLLPERRKQILRMADHPNAAVRSVAMWTLGRTGDITIAKILVHALEHDPHFDVVVDAQKALCWLSRKPQGFGLPDKPTDNLAPNATQEQKLKAIAAWRKKAVTVWKKWYLAARPYEERNDINETP